MYVYTDIFVRCITACAQWENENQFQYTHVSCPLKSHVFCKNKRKNFYAHSNWAIGISTFARALNNCRYYWEVARTTICQN